jgi:LAS superfamily LD-carboxypeptidase LdcB
MAIFRSARALGSFVALAVLHTACAGEDQGYPDEVFSSADLVNTCGAQQQGTANASDPLVRVNRFDPKNALSKATATPPSSILRTIPQEWFSKDLTEAANESKLRGEVLDAFIEFATQAKRDGFQFKIRSGHRSYELQQSIVAQRCAADKVKAEKFNAPPGSSQHHLASTFDVSYAAIDYALESAPFDTSPEGAYLKKNMPKFGFALSYPKGAEKTTGYEYEPWHWRFMGRNKAIALQAVARLTAVGSNMEGYLERCESPTSGEVCPRCPSTQCGAPSGSKFECVAKGETRALGGKTCTCANPAMDIAAASVANKDFRLSEWSCK